MTTTLDLADQSSNTITGHGGADKKDLVILFCLLIAHTCCFLPICFRIGFYLDDWLTFWNLHFAPHNLIDLWKASFNDPRMVTRPVQCVYYGLTYFLFGDRPVPYQILRFALEFVGAAFLYFGLRRITLNRLLPCLAVLFFLLFPSHDSTHYWIGSGLGPGFGLTLYLASFFFLMNFTSLSAPAAKVKTFGKWMWFGFSVLTFGLCAFCYESFLPMLSMSFCGLLLSPHFEKAKTTSRRILSAALLMVPFLVIGICEPIYQRIILPQITKTFLSPSAFDPQYFVNVFVQGANVSIGPAFWVFCFERVRDAVISINTTFVVQLIGVLLSAGFAVAIANSRELLSSKAKLSAKAATSAPIISTTSTTSTTSDQDQAGVRDREVNQKNTFGFLGASVVIFVCSYLTFSVAQGYTPVLGTIINRVNIGASVAVSIAIATVLSWFVGAFKRPGNNATIPAVAISTTLVALFTLANFGLAAFWICSWDVQKNIRFLIQKQAAQIKPGDSIILGGVHRYLMWAPVFDGTWDFESMVRMTLNTNEVQGGVICDRLLIDGTNIIDKSAGFVCASFPANRTTVLFPSGPTWIPVRSAQGFIDTIQENKNELILDQTTIDRWRAELNATANAPNRVIKRGI